MSDSPFTENSPANEANADNAALREREAHFRDLFERAPLPYQSLDVDGKLLEVNLAWRQLFGYARAEVIGRNIGEFLTEGSRQRLAIAFPQLKATGAVAGLSVEIICKDGRQRCVEITGNTSCDAEGCFVCTHCLLTDITEREAARAALRDHEERLRLFFEHSPIGILMVARDFRLMDVNDAFCRLVGYTAEELRAMSFVDLTHPDDRGADMVCANDMLAGRISHFTVEKRYIHKTGRPVWVRVTRAVVRDDNGEVRYGIGLVEDIAESREADKLRIDRLEQQRSVLVREVHHRIKNNLQGVISLIEQLKLKTPEAAEALEEAAGQVSTIAVVHGLYSGSLAAEVQPRELVRAIVDSVTRLSGVAVACHESHEGHDGANWNWRLNTRDTVSVAMVVNELVYNAVKHTEPGGKVEVSFGGQSGAFGIRIHNGPATLPPAFDFSAGIGVGTGLTLVASLLPRPGATLSIRQRIDGVEAHLRLTHPCANAVPATGQENAT